MAIKLVGNVNVGLVFGLLQFVSTFLITFLYVRFADRKLDRLTKEVLAFAASMTAKSDYGVDRHLREARRLGLNEQGLGEAVEVVQLFNTVTKIADALQLQPDFDPRRQP